MRREEEGKKRLEQARAEYERGLLSGKEIEQRLESIVSSYSGTKAAEAALEYAGRLRSHTISKMREKLKEVLAEADALAKGMEFAEALEKIDKVLLKKYQKELSGMVHELERRRESILSTAEKAFEDTCRSIVEVADAGNPEGAEKKLNETFQAFGISSLGAMHRRYLREIELIRRRQAVLLRCSVKEDLERVEMLITTYRFKEAAELCAGLSARADDELLKEQIIEKLHTAELMGEVKAYILKMVNGMGGVKLSDIGGGSGTIVNLKEEGFSIREEGVEAEFPWEKIGEREYAGLVAMAAERNHAGALFLCGVRAMKTDPARAEALSSLPVASLMATTC